MEILAVDTVDMKVKLLVYHIRQTKHSHPVAAVCLFGICTYPIQAPQSHDHQAASLIDELAP